MTNDNREPLISKDENTANAVTEVTEEDLRSAVQKISSLATVVCFYFRVDPCQFSRTTTSGQESGIFF